MSERSERAIRLSRLARINPTTAFVVALVVLLAGFFAPGIVGAALLLVVTAAAGALTFTTWPVQNPVARSARLLMLGGLIAVAAAKLW